MSTTQETTHYQIHWHLPDGTTRYNRAELYESMGAAIAAAETMKAQYAPLARRWLALADYQIVTVVTRRTVREGQ